MCCLHVCCWRVARMCVGVLHARARLVNIAPHPHPDLGPQRLSPCIAHADAASVNSFCTGVFALLQVRPQGKFPDTGRLGLTVPPCLPTGTTPHGWLCKTGQWAGVCIRLRRRLLQVFSPPSVLSDSQRGYHGGVPAAVPEPPLRAGAGRGTRKHTC